MTITYVPMEEYDARAAAHRAAVDDWIAAFDTFAGCAADNPQADQCGFAPTAPDDFTFGIAGEPTEPAPVLTPQQAAHLAVARLTLTPPTPGIGPDPAENEWQMAAVGYPLWLWAEGTLDPAAVSDTVAGLSVSLDARLTQVVFDLGDGTRLTCTDVTRAWTPAVRPGQESPVCGHRYARPSLPQGSYTVTASTHWAIDWQVNGTTGTLPLIQSSSTQIPVGELQVLVR